MAQMKTWMKLACLALVTAALAVGCETSTLEDQGTVTLAELEGQTPEPVITNETLNDWLGGKLDKLQDGEKLTLPPLDPKEIWANWFIE